MKNIFVFTFVVIINSVCFSQKQNYKITYRHNLQYDTLKKLTDTLGMEAILIGNSDESNYSFAKMPKTLEPVSKKDDKTFQDIINQKQSGTFTVKVKGFRYDSIGNMVYQNKINKTLMVREKMTNEYIVTEEKTPIIKWTITNEVKMINNYTCTKAIAYFRGRDYVAWFTTDIAIVAAPWKFTGLPGLVMDIEDTKFQVKIYVQQIEYPTAENVPNFVNSGTKITMEKYFTFRDEEFKVKLIGMREVSMQQDNVSQIIAKGGTVGELVTSNVTMYNIELRKD
ncbi:MAG: GLPGLI family protein [Ferruginibacter sp.]